LPSAETDTRSGAQLNGASCRSKNRDQLSITFCLPVEVVPAERNVASSATIAKNAALSRSANAFANAISASRTCSVGDG
jgi:hypothetical protein